MSISNSKQTQLNIQRQSQLGDASTLPEGGAYFWDDLFFCLWDSGYKMLIG